MTPKFEILCDSVTLYEGDCLDVLPTLEPGSVDAVVTDPPYGNNYSTGRRIYDARSSTQIARDKLTQPILNDVAATLQPILNDVAATLQPILNDVAATLQPILNDVAAVYWCAAPDRLDMVLPIIRRHWEVVNVLCWDKGNCTAGDLECSYGKQWEAIVYARTARIPLSGARDRDILSYSRGNTNEYVHPTQKPLSLMSYLIRRHEHANTILDPFAGSGTTAIAALMEGRRCILIEKDPHYCEIIRERVRAYDGRGKGSLFKSVPPSLFTESEVAS